MSKFKFTPPSKEELAERGLDEDGNLLKKTKQPKPAVKKKSDSE